MIRFAAIVACAMACHAPPAADVDDLVGMWSARGGFDVGASGELVIARTGSGWHATIGGRAADGPGLELAFDRDRARGALGSDGAAIDGFWQRRAVTDDPRYPIGATQGYATPIHLARAGDGTWRGAVTPLADPFRIFVRFLRAPDGTLVAAIRDPEQNEHAPALQLTVLRQGNALELVGKSGVLVATIDHGRIALAWPELGRTLEFTRGGDREFFPRPPGTAPYRYRTPSELGDGWPVAAASSLGVDEAALARMVQSIIAADPAAAKRVYPVHSIAIAYRGKLILDEYFHGFTAEQPHDMRSASKTFASVLLGAAMLRGAPISADTKVYDVLAPLGPFANPDPRKAAITVGQLLAHSAGFACDDNADDSPGNEDRMESQRAQPDWRKFTLDLPMAFAPGTHYAYCSANINLAGAAIALATHAWLPQLFEDTVARPLQFGAYHWNVMPNGEGYAGGGVFVRTRDFLKLGQAYLDGGEWNHHRIVPASWVTDSISPHMRVSPETTGRYGEAFRDVYGDGYDAYAWHLTDVKAGDRAFHAYFANGNGGQLLLVVPELDLAVMATAGNYNDGMWIHIRDALIGAQIIPAILASRASTHP
jgi:CubicO group peptidase (beta-lactamase class C family)